MKTIVLQSFRRDDVPPWLMACMDSVHRWAVAQGYEYRFVGDELFDPLPDWFVQRAAPAKTLWSDLARAQWARRLLESGYARFVWVDADVLVFKPQALNIDSVRSYAFCHEIWLHEDPVNGARSLHHKINNSVSVYLGGNPFLDFYLHAMERIARGSRPLTPAALGTELLTHLGLALPLPLLPMVGLFNPPLLRDIVTGHEPNLRQYMAASRAEFAAANLCHSFRGQTRAGLTMSDELYEQAVRVCLETRGEVFNRHYAARHPLPPAPPADNPPG